MLCCMDIILLDDEYQRLRSHHRERSLKALLFEICLKLWLEVERMRSNFKRILKWKEER